MIAAIESECRANLCAASARRECEGGRTSCVTEIRASVKSCDK
jgi:hypothetical protein